MVERWLPVPGFEGRYEVSDLGRIRSFGKSKAGRLRKLTKNHAGYLTVDLWQDGRPTNKRVNRVVLEAFVGPPPEEAESLHANGVRDDNRLCNLRWGSKLENMSDLLTHGSHPNQRKTHCVHGHEFTQENTYHRKSGGRLCIECRRRWVREWRQRANNQKGTQ